MHTHNPIKRGQNPITCSFLAAYPYQSKHFKNKNTRLLESLSLPLASWNITNSWLMQAFLSMSSRCMTTTVTAGAGRPNDCCVLVVQQRSKLFQEAHVSGSRRLSYKGAGVGSELLHVAISAQTQLLIRWIC